MGSTDRGEAFVKELADSNGEFLRYVPKTAKNGQKSQFLANNCLFSTPPEKILPQKVPPGGFILVV